MAQHEYRLTVYKTTNENTVDFYATEIAQLPDSFGAQRINLLEGRSESLNWTLRLNETQAVGGGGWGITDQLADASGHADLLQRRVALQRRAGGSTGTWTTVAGGRIINMSQTDDMAWDVEVGDERWVERNSQTFTKAGTVTLWPFGLRNDWSSYSAVSESDSGYVASAYEYSASPRVIKLGTGDGVKLTAKARSALEADRLPGRGFGSAAFSERGYGYARVRLVSDSTVEYQIASIDSIRLPNNYTGGQLGPIYILDPTSSCPTFEDGDSAEWAVIYTPDAPASNSNILHVGGTTGVHAFKFLRDLYDGAYQSTASSTGDPETVRTVRYSTAVLSEYDAATNPGGLINNPSWPRIWPRVKATASIAEAAEEYVYRPFGFVPALDNSGAVKPVSVALPSGDNVPSTTGLFEFDAANLRAAPTWQHEGKNQVTAVDGKYDILLTPVFYSADPDQPEFGDVDIDGLIAEEQTVRFVSDRLRAGTAIKRDVTVKTPGIWSADNARTRLEQYAADAFARYGDGPQEARVYALSAASTVAVGDIVVVNVDTFPNTYNRQLGGRVVMQVTSRAVTPDGYSFDLIHVGPDLQPLNAPSITLNRSTGDPYHTIEVTAAGGTTSDTLEVQFARSAVAPTARQWRTVATAKPSATVQVSDLRSGTKYYGRGRLMRPNRIKSSWSTADSTSTQTLTAPSSLSSTAFGTNWAQLTWANGTTAEDTQVHNSTQGIIARVPRGSDRYLVTGMTKDYNYVFRVRHIDDFGGISAWSTQCTVTPSSSGSGTLGVGRPGFLEIVLGADSLTSRVS